jgi:hypothetical protein
MRLNSKVFLAGLVIAAAVMVMRAQPGTDLSGTWKLNTEQSRFTDPGATPKEIILKFDQQGQTLHETLTVVNDGGKSTVSLIYALGGGASTNRVDGDEIKTTADWNKGTLVLEWRDHGGTFTRRITFSDNRQEMTVNAHDASPDGERWKNSNDNSRGREIPE